MVNGSTYVIMFLDLVYVCHCKLDMNLFHSMPTVSGHSHDDVIKWKHFPRNWPFVRGIHRSPVISPHKGQWRGAFMVTLICARINGWVNTREAGDLRRYRPHYDVIVMYAFPRQFTNSYLLYWPRFALQSDDFGGIYEIYSTDYGSNYNKTISFEFIIR